VADAQRDLAGDRLDVAADTLARLGVSHVVAPTDALSDRLAESSRFRPVWRSSPLAIFAVEPRPGQPDPSSLLTTAGPASARSRRGAGASSHRRVGGRAHSGQRRGRVVTEMAWTAERRSLRNPPYAGRADRNGLARRRE